MMLHLWSKSDLRCKECFKAMGNQERNKRTWKWQARNQEWFKTHNDRNQFDLKPFKSQFLKSLRSQFFISKSWKKIRYHRYYYLLWHMQRVEHQILRWTSLNVNIFHRFLWSWWKWWDDIWSPIIYENYSGLEQPGSTAPFAAKSFFCISTILNNHTVCIIHLTFKECTQFVLSGRVILKYFGSGSGVWQVFADLVHRICPQEKAAQEDFICMEMKAVQSFVSHTPGVWHLSRPLIWHKPEPVFLPVSNPVIL